MYDFLIPNIYDIDQLLNSEQSSWKTFVSIKQLDWYRIKTKPIMPTLFWMCS